MTDKFLYETLDAAFDLGLLKKEVPEFLKEHDKWKQEFLKEITEKYKGKTLDFITLGKTQKYRLVGVPFYNNEDENKFKQCLYEVIEN